MPRLFLFAFMSFVAVAAYMAVAPFLGLPYVRLGFNELGLVEYFLIAIAGITFGRARKLGTGKQKPEPSRQ